MNLKVQITAHEQNLIIETLNEKEDKNFIPVGPNRLGSVLIETDKFLGMSKEAADLLKTIKKSHDDIGDICVWKTNDNKDCFSWLGGFKKIIDVTIAEGDSSGIADIRYVTIKNIVPPEALKVLTKK